MNLSLFFTIALAVAVGIYLGNHWNEFWQAVDQTLIFIFKLAFWFFLLVLYVSVGGGIIWGLANFENFPPEIQNGLIWAFYAICLLWIIHQISKMGWKSLKQFLLKTVSPFLNKTMIIVFSILIFLLILSGIIEKNF